MPARPWLVEGIWALGTGAVALVLAAVWLQIWDAKLHIPLYTSGDASFSLMTVKSVMEHGWIGIEPHLGAPYGSSMYDDAVIFGDTFHLLVIKVLALGSSDPVAVMNVFYMLSYALTAITGYAVLRDLGFERPASSVAGALFALLPYHFFRSESHLFLAAYYSVPLGCWLVLRSMRGDVLWARRARPGPRLLQWASRRSIVTLLVCGVVGTAEVYYAAFTLLLLVPLTLLGALAARDARRVIAPAAVTMAVAGSAVAVQLPAIAWHAKHGANTEVTQRAPFESELYALKLAELVVPLRGHPFGPLDGLGKRYYNHLQAQDAEGGSAALGSWLTIGFGAVLLLAGLGAVGLRLRGRGRLVADAGVAAAVAFLFGTIGGAGALFGFFVSSQLRGWNRVSVFIAFFAAIGLAWLLSSLLGRARGRAVRVVAIGALLAVLFSGWLDQTRVGFRPDYAAAAAAWRNDGRFVSGVDRQLPPDAAVLQLPYMPFPEHGPLERIADYDQLKGFLHTDDLRWSYGAMKGREPEDWGAVLDRMPVRQALPAAVAAGFRGLVIDTYGYADGGARIVRQVEQVTGGASTLVSSDGRLVFFDLQPMARRVARLPSHVRGEAAEALLEPIDLTYGAGFYPAESDHSDTWHWAEGRASLTFHNDGSATRSVALSFSLRTPGPASQPVALRLPDGSSRTVRVPGGRRQSVRLTLALPMGDSALRLSTRAPRETGDPRDLHVQVLNLRVTDVGLRRATRGVGG